MTTTPDKITTVRVLMSSRDVFKIAATEMGLTIIGFIALVTGRDCEAALRTLGTVARRMGGGPVPCSQEKPPRATQAKNRTSRDPSS